MHDGLVVVEFEVAGAIEFCDAITRRNVTRLKIDSHAYRRQLFTAAIASGLAYGAMAERMR